MNDKSGKPVRIVSIELGIPKALEGNYYHLKLLARKMKKSGIISKYRIILGNSGPEISVLGHDIRETTEERQRWFTVRKQFPSIRDFSFLDLSKTSEDWEMEEGSPEIYSEKTKVIKEIKNREPENTSGPKSKKRQREINTSVEISIPRKVFRVKIGGSVVVDKIEPKNDDSEKNKTDKPETSTPIRKPEMGGGDDPTQEK